MLIRAFAIVAMVALASVSPAASQTGETPATLEGAKTVTPNDVKALIGKATFLDVRRKAAYLEGRLPGAKSVAPKGEGEARAFDPVTFGADKSAPIVIYGHGSDGWSAVLAVRNAVAAGFTNVHWMRTGWAAWSAEKLPTEQ